MFGWKKLGFAEFDHRKRYGWDIQREEDGHASWLTFWFGHSAWNFVKYHKPARLTGPEQNDNVLHYFFGGPELRSKGRSFRSGFKEAAAKGPAKGFSRRQAQYRLHNNG